VAETPPRGEAMLPPLIRERWGIIAVCCLATSAFELQPPLWLFHYPPPSAFELGWVEVNLLVSLTTLPALGFVLLGGVLGDLYGRRRVLLIGLGGQVVANLLLLITPALPWFLTTRLAAGAFGALVLPLSLALLTLAFADDARARAAAIAIYIAITTAAYYLALLLVPIILAQAGFRAVIVAPTLVTLAAIPLVRRVLAESRCTDDRHFDAVGHTAWALALLSVTYGVKLWTVAGQYVSVVLGASLVGCLLGMGVLLWWDRRGRDSVLQQNAMPRGRLAALIAYGVVLQFGIVGFATQVRGALIGGYGFGPVTGTAALAPLLLGMLTMVVVGTRRLEGLRVRPTLAIGLAVIGLVCALSALTHAAGTYPWLAVLLFVFGAAMIACNTAWTFAFLHAIDERMIGVRTGINSAMLQLGAVAGGTVASALLATLGLAEAARLLRERGISPAELDAVLASLNALLSAATTDPTALDSAAAQQLIAAYRLVYVASYERVLLVIAAVCFVGSAAAVGGGRTTARLGLRARAESEELTLAGER
jgi:MFS family permease